MATPLLAEPLDVALAADHPLSARDRLVAADLADERWVSVHDGFPLAGVVTHLAALAGRAPRIAHRVNDFATAAELVRADGAIAILPRVTARSLATDGLVLRPIADAPLVRHVDALARPDALASAAVRRVLAALVRAARDAQPRG